MAKYAFIDKEKMEKYANKRSLISTKPNNNMFVPNNLLNLPQFDQTNYKNWRKIVNN